MHTRWNRIVLSSRNLPRKYFPIFFFFFSLHLIDNVIYEVRRKKIYLYRVFDREVAGLKSGSSSKQIGFHFRPIRISMNNNFINGEILNFLASFDRKSERKSSGYERCLLLSYATRVFFSFAIVFTSFLNLLKLCTKIRIERKQKKQKTEMYINLSSHCW